MSWAPGAIGVLCKGVWSRSLRTVNSVDVPVALAPAASLSRDLLHGLRNHGAVRARQAPRDPPGREQVYLVDGSELAAADPYLMRAQQVVGGQDGNVMGEQVLQSPQQLGEVP